MELLERFLKYVAFDTQSSEESETFPSTDKQKLLLAALKDEMISLGMEDVAMDSYGYVTGTLAASADCENVPVIGFISHVDTSPEMPGAGVKPKIVENYDGGRIELNSSLSMGPEEFPELTFFKGKTLVTTDGTTLLGADDKAGVAEIMTAMEYLVAHPEIKHGKIRVGFTPDEEIGRGVDFFDVEKFAADYAYTMDGGFEGELEFENFNAASAKFNVNGRNIHPGYAKDKMVNASDILCEINSLVPKAERPQHTDGYDGFYHLVSLQGSVETGRSSYIVRDHSREMFERRKEFLRSLVSFMDARYGKGVVELELNDQYYNMREMVEPHPSVILNAKKAMELAGVTPIVRPIRGGTDGARLSFMGLPCPNLFTGGMNFHGKFEYCCLETMQKSVQVIINLANLWAE